MRIEHFQGVNVHGYLQFQVPFNDDITMLHGINGAGKTTAVRAIMALLNPDIYWLATNDFQSVAVKFIYNDHHYEVSAHRESEHLSISIQGSVDPYKNQLTSRFPLRYIDFISERMRAHRRNHQLLDEEIERHFPPDTDLTVVRAIREFPTPTFLGLERTTLPPDLGDEAPASDRNRRLGLYSRLWLEASITEALRLAKDAYDNRYRKLQNELMARLRSRIILSLFQKAGQANRVGVPTQSQLGNYPEMQKRITAVLRQLQLVTDHDIRREVEPFFSELQAVANNLTSGLQNPTLSDTERTTLIVKWLDLESPLRAIDNVINLTQEYERDDTNNFLPFKHYQDTLNGFLRDSGKEIRFSETGNIEAILPNGDKGDVGQLSSGERQLFVLLTHLAFNRKTKDADVLIIDEPELSLHLKWQQRFVKAIIDTSPSTQVILATHSPSIIGKYKDRCVSLNAKARSASVR